MRWRWWSSFFLGIVFSLLALVPSASSTSLSPELGKDLESSKYIYLQSERKDGSLSKPAEIWFMFHNGAVWVASPVTTHRVKRVQAGKTKAKIAVGKPGGPSFNATGSIVKDPEVNKVLFETFAKKYADGWSSYEQQFKSGLADGSRALIKYDPAP